MPCALRITAAAIRGHCRALTWTAGPLLGQLASGASGLVLRLGAPTSPWPGYPQRDPFLRSSSI